MRNAPNLPTASSLAQVPHSVGRPWTNTNRTARFCEGPPMLVRRQAAVILIYYSNQRLHFKSGPALLAPISALLAPNHTCHADKSCSH